MLISVNNKFQQGMHFKLKNVVGLLINSKSTTEVVLLISFKLMIEVDVLKLLRSIIAVGQLTILE